jgi:hypothetical protein
VGRGGGGLSGFPRGGAAVEELVDKGFHVVFKVFGWWESDEEGA